MKIGSISGLVYASTDLDKTAAFYETLGFRPGKRTDREYTCYVNWFWLTFSTETETETETEAETKTKADSEATATAAADTQADAEAGPTLYLKVDNIDDAYAAVQENGFTPLDEPHKDGAGRRVFTLPDPDGNRLAFFAK